MILNNDIDVQVLEKVTSETKFQHPYNLIVWNDDVNTFDWIIESLIEVCEHTEEQAEQCALLIHFQGKYGVKNGTLESLKTMCTAITDRGINATIEEMVNSK